MDAAVELEDPSPFPLAEDIDRAPMEEDVEMRVEEERIEPEPQEEEEEEKSDQECDITAPYHLMKQLVISILKHLADELVRARIERNLAPEDIVLVNNYRRDSLVLAQNIIEVFATLKSIYMRVSTIDDLKIGLGHFCKRLQEIDISPLINKCVELMRINGELTEKLNTATDRKIKDWLIENRFAISTAIVGLILWIIPGCQFGIPLWMEKVLTSVGVTLSSAGALVFSKNWLNDPCKPLIQQLQRDLSAINGRMQKLRTKLVEYAVGHECAASDEAFLRLEAATLSAECDNIVRLGEEVETATLKVPALVSRPATWKDCSVM